MNYIRIQLDVLQDLGKVDDNFKWLRGKCGKERLNERVITVSPCSLNLVQKLNREKTVFALIAKKLDAIMVETDEILAPGIHSFFVNIYKSGADWKKYFVYDKTGNDLFHYYETFTSSQVEGLRIKTCLYKNDITQILIGSWCDVKLIDITQNEMCNRKYHCLPIHIDMYGIATFLCDFIFSNSPSDVYKLLNIPDTLPRLSKNAQIEKLAAAPKGSLRFACESAEIEETEYKLKLLKEKMSKIYTD